MFSRVEAFVREAKELRTEEQLAEAVEAVARDLGFRYFALTHHVDLRGSGNFIRLHNYPSGWAEWFDEHELALSDPVHRASNLTSVGFAWSELADMLKLTPGDLKVLDASPPRRDWRGFHRSSARSGRSARLLLLCL